MAKIPLGLIGSGRIARTQHIPALAENPDFKLAAVTSHDGGIEGLDHYQTAEDMLADHPEIEAVAIATPTPNHYPSARSALLAGKHTMIEKPPCASNAQFDHLVMLGARVKRTLFQTWHHCYAPRVAEARKWLKTRIATGGYVEWKENVRDCHPGQDWVWQPGGFGVFDPGINALSLLLRILPEPVFVESAELFTPRGCATPVAADVMLRTEGEAPIRMTLDFAYRGPPCRTISIDTVDGQIDLTEAATVLSVNGRRQDTLPAVEPIGEYTKIYRRFAELIAKGESDADPAPLRLVGDIYLLAKHTVVASRPD